MHKTKDAQSPPVDGDPVETDNSERPGIDPAQDVSQDPELDYSKESL